MNDFNKLEINKAISSRNKKDKRIALIMILPALIFIIALIGYPLFKIVIDSFLKLNLVNVEVKGFAGIDNFKNVISDEHFIQSVKNTITWTAFSVLGEYLLGMITAILLNQNIKGKIIFRTLIFTPWLVPIMVAGMTWSWMLDPNFGIINYLLTHLHILKSPIDFIGNSRYAMGTVIFVNIWRSFPYYTITFLAGMQSIPNEIIEAASIDGAGFFKTLFKIILPQLRTVTLVIVFMHIIWTSINFDFIWIMTQGGPNYATMTLPIMIYRYSMQLFDVGAASSLSLMMFLIMLIFFVFYYRERIKINEDKNY
ncbi:carbohydrate ABC transporter permease [Thermoanaerobacterium thermosaccharolyticum]|uniref:carbohydrate ABC transporter permease n=1 Tax=Thermoanaerobacterium thermosaccharolyticum TaxID=1517 RepID=UPI003DA978F3